MLLEFIKPYLKKKTTVMIIGNYSGDNIGDNAILKTMLHDLKNEDSIKRIIIPSRTPDRIRRFTRELPQHKIDVVKLSGRFFQSLSYGMQSDIIVVGGGTIFSKYAGTFVYLLPHFLNLLKFCGKKVVFYSLGFESSCPALIKGPVIFSMLLANRISVRDKKSRKTLSFVSRFKKIELIPDPVLRLPEYMDNETSYYVSHEMQELAGKYGNLKNTVICGFNYVKDKSVNDKLELQLTELLDCLAEHDEKCVLLTFYSPNDLILNKKIQRILRHNQEHLVVIEETLDPLVVMALMKQSKLVIAERLHAMILAHVAGARFYPLVYQEKCQAFLEQIGNSEGMTIKEFVSLTDLNGFIKKIL